MDADGNNNSVSPLNSLLFQNMQQSSESRSESSSVESDMSDINIIALQMGVNPEDLAYERFKVDRQKLENMIKDNAAEYFFDNIIKTTSTRISWPCRLKIGAKTKKDPHVRIVGKKMDVLRAKDRVLGVLDSRGCRVIMKMDISYTDHSYIIGRGGNNIKKIMEDTLTHIHFPDSNRSNPLEKSNQVSLCGSMEGVERARALVRLSTPLIISFESPIIYPGHPMPDGNTDYVKDVKEKFNIEVIFSSRSKLHSSLILVKGSEQDAKNVCHATEFLIIHMYQCNSSLVPVNLHLEISPQHHDIVKGRNNMNILTIMESTNTKIIFPDLNDANIKPIKKSQVTITGNIEGVYKARQQLIGNLPVALIFDYPENTMQDDTIIKTLNHKFGVFIVTREKSRQSTLCIVIKGVEKFVDKMYEARHVLLDLKTPMVKAEIPSTYRERELISDIQRQNLVEILSGYPDSPLTPGAANFMPQFPKPSAHQMQYGNRLTPSSIAEITSRMQNLPLSPANIHRLQAMQLQQNGNGHQNMNLMPSYQTSMRSSVSPRSSGTNTSGYLSNLNTSASSNSLEQMYPPYKLSIQTTDVNGITTFPQMENQPFGNSMNGNGMNLSCRLNENAGNPYGDEYELPTPNFPLPRMIDFDRKRIEGHKAKRFDTPRTYTPNNAWSGLYLSETSPFALNLGGASNASQFEPREKLHFDKASTTGLIAAMTSDDRGRLSECKTIEALLHHLKLSHYINNFLSHDIDMKIFATLTSEDLLELNINAFGARKLLLLAIKQLKSETRPSDDWIKLSDFKDIHALLEHLNMKDYTRNFLMHEIDMKMFITLENEEMLELGVKSLADRKRLLLAIDQLKSEHFAGSAAPGAEMCAERRASKGW